MYEETSSESSADATSTIPKAALHPANYGPETFYCSILQPFRCRTSVVEWYIWGSGEVVSNFQCHPSLSLEYNRGWKDGTSITLRKGNVPHFSGEWKDTANRKWKPRNWNDHVQSKWIAINAKWEDFVSTRVVCYHRCAQWGVAWLKETKVGHYLVGVWVMNSRVHILTSCDEQRRE